MKQYEYEITKHEAETFNKLIYFCSDAGKCKLEKVSLSQMNILTNLLNERGKSGWEMVQVSFGKDGIIVFWKRELVPAKRGKTGSISSKKSPRKK